MGPIGCPQTSVTSNLHCVTSQKSEDLVYTAAEDWNHVREKFHGYVFDLLNGYWNHYWVVPEPSIWTPFHQADGDPH
jgi:hypothetical protein